MVEFLKSAKTISEFPSKLNEVVFVGRSNAGKSSLLNSLYKKDIAYVGKTPGKTKLINFFNIDNKYLAVDVPGYGYANRSKKEAIEFGQMMEEYFSRKEVKYCVMIVDSRIGLTNDDLDMKEFLEDKKIKYVIVANKIDKLSNNELFNVKNKIFNEYKNIIFISALKRKNIDELKQLILNNI